MGWLKTAAFAIALFTQHTFIPNLVLIWDNLGNDDKEILINLASVNLKKVKIKNVHPREKFVFKVSGFEVFCNEQKYFCDALL